MQCAVDLAQKLRQYASADHSTEETAAEAEATLRSSIASERYYYFRYNLLFLYGMFLYFILYIISYHCIIYYIMLLYNIIYVNILYIISYYEITHIYDMIQ